MSILTTTDDAEQVAKAWMQRKYGRRLGKVKFVEVMSGNGVWNVKANVKLAAGVLLLKPCVVQVTIDAASTDVLGYTESEFGANSG